MEQITEEKYELNAEAAKAFTFAPGKPPVFESLVHGTVDIRTVTTGTIESLIAAGNKYFVPKEKESKVKPIA